MPLRDHFHPPLSVKRHWEGLHGAWANEIRRRLNAILPPRYFAEALIRVGGRVEVDVGTFDQPEMASAAQPGGGLAVWTLPRPTFDEPVDFTDPDLFEIQVFTDQQGPELVAAIELISPSNKDRPSQRKMFITKCASYLQQEVGLVLVDVVTERNANLHAELFDLLNIPRMPLAPGLYAGSYRTVSHDRALRVESWYEPLSIGATLPTLPLWIGPDRFVPLELEPAYEQVCLESRIR